MFRKVLRYSKSISVALFLITGLILSALPVYAIDDPDSPPAVNAVYVYEDLLEDGDVGVLIEYFLDYTVTPTETVTEAYLMAFIDTDGTTQLKAIAPYTFTDSGYGYGAAWIYFDAGEVIDDAITSADAGLYRIWFMGNPTVASGWTGDPPKTIASIDTWYTTGDSAVLLALDVLEIADFLELEWTLDLVEVTGIGNRLTDVGASYFENVITNLRYMAPAAFSASTVQPNIEDIDYTTEFGAVLTNGTGTAAGSPITLTEGNNNVNVTGLGTFTVVLEQGTVGTATTDVCTVAGSPAALVAGTNTITCGGVIGNIVVAVNLVDTTTGIEDSVTGTGWDLTAVATAFGMTRWMFSGIIWMVMSVLICAAIYKVSPDQYAGYGAGKTLFPAFIICVIAGTLLGLLKPIVGIMMFILIAGFFVGYILLFRGANT